MLGYKVNRKYISKPVALRPTVAWCIATQALYRIQRMGLHCSPSQGGLNRGTQVPRAKSYREVSVVQIPVTMITGYTVRRKTFGVYRFIAGLKFAPYAGI